MPQTTNRPVSPANPPHYRAARVESIDVMRDNATPAEFLGHCRCNALKYLLRAGKKDVDATADDFAKAAWYAAMGAHVLDPVRHEDPRLAGLTGADLIAARLLAAHARDVINEAPPGHPLRNGAYGETVGDAVRRLAEALGV